MHVAFGRVRRKSRILADLADDTDFGVFSASCDVYLSLSFTTNARRFYFSRLLLFSQDSPDGKLA